MSLPNVDFAVKSSVGREREVWQLAVVLAARKFVECKGRYHSELHTKTLIELFRMEPKDE